METSNNRGEDREVEERGGANKRGEDRKLRKREGGGTGNGVTTAVGRKVVEKEREMERKGSNNVSYPFTINLAHRQPVHWAAAPTTHPACARWTGRRGWRAEAVAGVATVDGEVVVDDRMGARNAIGAGGREGRERKATTRGVQNGLRCRWSRCGWRRKEGKASSAAAPQRTSPRWSDCQNALSWAA